MMVIVLALVALLWTGPAGLRAEKLSVLLPGQNAEFELEHTVPEVDIRSSGGRPRLSPPQNLPTPTTNPSLVLDAPPAIVPTFPPASVRGSNLPDPGPDTNIQVPVPPINVLYDVPDAETRPQTTQGVCQAQTVVVTSRDVVVSTSVSVSQVVVPTTVVQSLTSTKLQLQTSYVTVQGPVQTQTKTVTTKSVKPAETVYVTSTMVQQQVVTSTRLQVQTQVVTSRVVESQLVTVTQTVSTSVVETVLSTQYQRQYVTTTQTQYVTTTAACATTPSKGYSYPAPGGGGAFQGGSSRPSYGGYYVSGYQGPFYGPYYARPASYFQQSRKKGLFGKWGL
ncbi:uncharacterized protein [Panulirus ornatus]|uniref:uncharacterized protein n=1 Tax=Panulirus ornatus TaxID=150431 RepID=UPI003A8A9CC6